MELYGLTTPVENLLEVMQEGKFAHDVDQLEIYGRQKEVGFFAILLGNMMLTLRGLVPAFALHLAPVGLTFQWVLFMAGAYCLVTGIVLHQVRDASSELKQLLDGKYMLMTLGSLLAVLGGFDAFDILCFLKNVTLYLVFVHLCSMKTYNGPGSLRSIYLGSMIAVLGWSCVLHVGRCVLQAL